MDEHYHSTFDLAYLLTHLNEQVCYFWSSFRILPFTNMDLVQTFCAIVLSLGRYKVDCDEM